MLGTGTDAKFGMRGADIVLGHAGGVETRYASDFVGTPALDSSLAVTNASTAVAGDGRVTVSFTRPLIGGKLKAAYNVNASIVSPEADVLWAVGAMGSGKPSYHGHARGLRFVDWENPQTAMASFACS